MKLRTEDRNGEHVHVGDPVRNIVGMAISGVRKGFIEYIDGEYIGVRMKVGNQSFIAERYSCEIEKVKP